MGAAVVVKLWDRDLGWFWGKREGRFKIIKLEGVILTVGINIYVTVG